MWNISKRFSNIQVPPQPAFFTSLKVVCIFVAISAILSWFVTIYPLANGNKPPMHVVHNQNHPVSLSPTTSALAVTAALTVTATATPSNPVTTATPGTKVRTTPITVTNPTSAPAVSTPTPVPVPVSGTIRDYLSSWSWTYSHTANLDFDTTNTQNFDGDTSRASRLESTPTHEAIVWRQKGITSFIAKTYFWSAESVSAFSILVSADGNNWTAVTPAITTSGTGNWIPYTYVLNNLSNANYIKMSWNNMQGSTWSPQISHVAIDYSYTQ